MQALFFHAFTGKEISATIFGRRGCSAYDNIALKAEREDYI
jgi:hypothetical protein